MSDIYNGESSLTIHEHALAHLLKAKGVADLADTMSNDERLLIFIFGLDYDIPWNETLLLIRGIWTVIGVYRDTDWKAWKEGMLKQYSHNGHLKHIVNWFGEGPCLNPRES